MGGLATEDLIKALKEGRISPDLFRNHPIAHKSTNTFVVDEIREEKVNKVVDKAVEITKLKSKSTIFNIISIDEITNTEDLQEIFVENKTSSNALANISVGTNSTEKIGSGKKLSLCPICSISTQEPPVINKIVTSKAVTCRFYDSPKDSLSMYSQKDIVEQIMQQLAFDVEAVPRNNDQTIINFDIYVDAEFDKKPPPRKTRKQIFDMLKPGSRVRALEDDDTYIPSSSYSANIIEPSQTTKSRSTLTHTFTLSKNVNQDHTVKTQSGEQKYFFGKCKPGGCLDPPFSEDKYSYKPSRKPEPEKNIPENVILTEEKTPDKEIVECDTDSIKQPNILRNREGSKGSAKQNSIFDGSFFKKKRKSNEQSTNTPPLEQKDSIVNIFQGEPSINSPSTHSNSIITYPPKISSGLKVSDHKIKSPSEDKPRKSSNEHSEPYFTPPKGVARDKEDDKIKRNETKRHSSDKDTPREYKLPGFMPVPIPIPRKSNKPDAEISAQTNVIWTSNDNKIAEIVNSEPSQDLPDNVNSKSTQTPYLQLQDSSTGDAVVDPIKSFKMVFLDPIVVGQPPNKNEDTESKSSLIVDLQKNELKELSKIISAGKTFEVTNLEKSETIEKTDSKNDTEPQSDNEAEFKKDKYPMENIEKKIFPISINIIGETEVKPDEINLKQTNSGQNVPVTEHYLRSGDSKSTDTQSPLQTETSEVKVIDSIPEDIEKYNSISDLTHSDAQSLDAPEVKARKSIPEDMEKHNSIPDLTHSDTQGPETSKVKARESIPEDVEKHNSISDQTHSDTQGPETSKVKGRKSNPEDIEKHNSVSDLTNSDTQSSDASEVKARESIPEDIEKHNSISNQIHSDAQNLDTSEVKARKSNPEDIEKHNSVSDLTHSDTQSSGAFEAKARESIPEDIEKHNSISNQIHSDAQNVDTSEVKARKSNPEDIEKHNSVSDLTHSDTQSSNTSEVKARESIPEDIVKHSSISEPKYSDTQRLTNKSDDKAKKPIIVDIENRYSDQKRLKKSFDSETDTDKSEIQKTGVLGSDTDWTKDLQNKSYNEPIFVYKRDKDEKSVSGNGKDYIDAPFLNQEIKTPTLHDNKIDFVGNQSKDSKEINIINQFPRNIPPKFAKIPKVDQDNIKLTNEYDKIIRTKRITNESEKSAGSMSSFKNYNRVGATELVLPINRGNNDVEIITEPIKTLNGTTDSNDDFGIVITEITDTTNIPILSSDQYDKPLKRTLNKYSIPVDLGFHSHLNDKNERIITTFDTKHVPKILPNDVVTIVKSEIRISSNEIRIPVDKEHEMYIEIKKTKDKRSSISESGFQIVTENGKRKSTDPKEGEINNFKSSKSHEVIKNVELEVSILEFYEKELIPLQLIIRNLRNEIDVLASQQLVFRDKIFCTNKTKSGFYGYKMENNINTVSKNVEKEDKYAADLDQALAVAGLGWYNIKYSLVLALFLIGAIIEPVGYSFVLPAAMCDLEMTDSQRGFIASIPYIGVVATSFPWGYLVDTRGRKNMVIIASFLAGVFGIVAAFMPDLITFAIVNIACPAAVPYTFIGEILPAKNRDVILSVTNALQVSGTLIVPLLAWGILPLDFRIDFGLPWRLLTILYACIFIIAAVLMVFGPESPKFLVSQGKMDEALKVLQDIYVGNKKDAGEFPIKRLMVPPHDTEKKTFFKSLRVQSVPLFKPPYLKWFALNSFLMFGVFSVLNGLYMWVPDVLNRVMTGGGEDKTACDVIFDRLNQTSQSDECVDTIETITFVINAVANASCTVICLAVGSCVKFIGKKRLLIIAFLLIGTFCILINFITQDMVFAVLLSSLQILALAIGPINAYSGEFFPTHLRGMAVGLTMMCGRTGSIVGINVAGVLLNAACEVTFYLFGGLLLVCGLLTFLLPGSQRPLIKKELQLENSASNNRNAQSSDL
ncbi:hypothetical protein HW555_001382 [Spodoptera exigua]|uniref:Major facilitator superfamily (MFS) profile domain-containing protein n=1 Tax=Spodoptera exigua TaxID=7107 RepID=A0A835GQL8_SPOEX|nr:hypothetical protein HW555_001382 [Spodoptera exigua]